MGGCDKTTPALLMGATSAGLPSVFIPAGPMLRGNWHGKVLGAGSDDVIRPLDRPVSSADGLAVLHGNLAPDGCVMKPAAAEPRLLRHTGPAIVFDDYDAMAASIDRDVTADHVMVLRNAGPQGGPGMPEWGMLPIPTMLVKTGVRDMVRLSDARMSGTSYGACILHIAPESFVGGPLALVRNGDLIEHDVPARRLTLHVDDDELARRRREWTPPAKRYPRGYDRRRRRHRPDDQAGPAVTGIGLRSIDVAPIEPLDASEDVLQGDLRDPAVIDRAFEGRHVVLHMAGTSVEHPLPEIIDNNLRALHEVFEGARRHRVRHVVFASSNHAFGMHEAGTHPGLDAPYRPDSLYDLSKVWARRCRGWTGTSTGSRRSRCAPAARCRARSRRGVSAPGSARMTCCIW